MDINTKALEHLLELERNCRDPLEFTKGRLIAAAEEHIVAYLNSIASGEMCQFYGDDFAEYDVEEILDNEHFGDRLRNGRVRSTTVRELLIACYGEDNVDFAINGDKVNAEYMRLIKNDETSFREMMEGKVAL